MKHSILKTFFLLFITILVTGCDKEDLKPHEQTKEQTKEQTDDIFEDHTVHFMSLKDYVTSNSYGAFKKDISDFKKKNVSSKNTGLDNKYEFIGTEVYKSYVDGQTTYTMAIKSENKNDDDYDLNLLIKENESGTTAFLIKYPKNGGNIIMQPINSDWANTQSKASKSKGGCTTILWSSTTPCGCHPQHTSGSCNCKTPYSESSGRITYCVEPPIDVKSPPSFGGPNAVPSVGGGASTPGGDASDPKYTPIYIYEGEAKCFGDGTCTPPLYWAQVVTKVETKELKPDYTIGKNTDFSINSANTLKINPVEELKNFDLTKGAKLIIYVQQPKENSNQLVGPNEVGHAFIGIEQNGIVRQLGFYPEEGANELFVGVGKEYDSEIRSNNDYLYHVSISKNITSSELTAIYDYIIDFPKTYDVNNYACTDFAIAVGNLGNMNLPSTTIKNMTFSGRSPGQLGQEIRVMSSNNLITISTVKNNSPKKKG